MSFLEKLIGPINASNDGQNEKKIMKEKEEMEKVNTWESGETEGQLSIDVYQTPADIVIRSTIAGVKPENLDIAITNDMVTVRGRREIEESVVKDDYFYQECYWGPFSRSIILPVDVQTDKSVATLKNGVLTIKLPKSERIKTKKIEIKHHEE
ncbi:MAG: Hsp20/alpha crystallin family protein [Candidatus Azambacteria bacterium]|nr:Hsp20/alpha crystallin family protein [Candidatus Azambacteria bacterium]